MMRILITGAKGMLGTDIYKVLRPHHQVTGIDIQEVDITQPHQIYNYLKPYRFDLIIHTAASTDVDGCEENPGKAFTINGIGTRNMGEYAKQINARFLYISTDYIFDGMKGEPYREDDVPNPINIYGKTKLEGEKYIQQLDIPYYIVRTSWLFGQNGKNFVNTILEKAKRYKSIEVVNDQFGSPTYTLDLAIAIAMLIKTEKYGIYHISNSGICSWYEFACEILKIKGLSNKVKVQPIGSGELTRLAKRPQYSKLDSSKYERITGHTLRSWQEALKEYLENINFAIED
ncbi:MAG: dTDP-4-dehydrorhamnose reductase [bacterium]|nr:dTDP-4-dehydrorhamnose reductase [bacterium]